MKQTFIKTNPGCHWGDRCHSQTSLKQSWNDSLEFSVCQQSFSNTTIFCLCFSPCFPCDLHHLVLSSVTLISNNCGEELFPFREIAQTLAKLLCRFCWLTFGNIDPLPYGPSGTGIVHFLTKNKTNKEKQLLLFPFQILKGFLASIFISLKEMHGSQLLSAGVCMHLFVYFLKCNWEYAQNHESVSVVHSKQIQAHRRQSQPGIVHFLHAQFSIWHFAKI